MLPDTHALCSISPNRSPEAVPIGTASNTPKKIFLIACDCTEGRYYVTANVLQIIPDEVVNASPLPGLRQTATRFPFTYTYYGFDASQEPESASAGASLTHNNDFARESSE
jgi:hypothetical protein